MSIWKFGDLEMDVIDYLKCLHLGFNFGPAFTEEYMNTHFQIFKFSNFQIVFP
jgi:hypothetical protein